LIDDVKLVLAGRISGIPRISRHLWRMCLGLTLAAGSGFTQRAGSAAARSLPRPDGVLPSPFLPLALLGYWLIRVRFTGWYKRDASA
jgi:hypothetical protein